MGSKDPPDNTVAKTEKESRKDERLARTDAVDNMADKRRGDIHPIVSGGPNRVECSGRKLGPQYQLGRVGINQDFMIPTGS